MDVITSYIWVGWIALILIFVIIEMLTVDFTFLMLAVGSLGGLVAELFGAPWWLQLSIAAVLSLLLLFTVRPWLRRLLMRGGDPTPSNVDALIGIDGRVVQAITSLSGQVKLANGETWSARISSDAGIHEMGVGEIVSVTAIEGATAVVVPKPPQPGQSSSSSPGTVLSDS